MKNIVAITLIALVSFTIGYLLAKTTPSEQTKGFVEVQPDPDRIGMWSFGLTHRLDQDPFEIWISEDRESFSISHGDSLLINDFEKNGHRARTFFFRGFAVAEIEYQEDGILNQDFYFDDEEGNPQFAYRDINADGRWNILFDHNARVVYDWKDDRWAPRKSSREPDSDGNAEEPLGVEREP